MGILHEKIFQFTAELFMQSQNSPASSFFNVSLLEVYKKHANRYFPFDLTSIPLLYIIDILMDIGYHSITNITSRKTVTDGSS